MTKSVFAGKLPPQFPEGAGRTNRLIRTHRLHKIFAAIVVAAGLGIGADPKVVEVTGVGPSRDLAIKDGLRSAVEKAVGTLVTSETEVSNNTLIRDDILSYSAGYVQDYKIISEQLTMGQVKLAISVQVSSLKLRQKLDSLNIAIAKLPGQAFAVQIDTKRKAEADAAAMLAPALNKYPKSAYKITVSSPRLKQDRGEVADVNLDYTITFDTAWVHVFESMAGAIANQKLKAPTPEELIRSNLHGTRGLIILATSPIRWNSLEFGFPQVGYDIPVASYKEVASSLNRPQRLVLQFYSEDREVVFTGNVNFRPTSRMVQGEDGLTDHANCNIGTCVGSTMGAWIYKDYTLSQSTEISIPVSVLRRIASVECFFASNEPVEAPTKQGNNADFSETNPSSYATGVGMEIGRGEGGGLEITSITPGGQAERVGLSDGASIISIGGKEISDPTEASVKLHGAIGSIVRVCVSTSIRDFCRELTVRPLTDR